jgi:hypothetical protein
MTLATAPGTALYVEPGRLLWGWTQAMLGDATDGVAELRQRLAAMQGMGLALMRPHGLSLLAEAYGRAGQPEAGLQTVVEALTLIEATEERWWAAELSRLKGTLLLQLRNPDAAQGKDGKLDFSPVSYPLRRGAQPYETTPTVYRHHRAGGRWLHCLVSRTGHRESKDHCHGKARTSALSLTLDLTHHGCALKGTDNLPVQVRSR